MTLNGYKILFNTYEQPTKILKVFGHNYENTQGNTRRTIIRHAHTHKYKNKQKTKGKLDKIIMNNNELVWGRT